MAAASIQVNMVSSFEIMYYILALDIGSPDLYVKD